MTISLKSEGLTPLNNFQMCAINNISQFGRYHVGLIAKSEFQNIWPWKWRSIKDIDYIRMKIGSELLSSTLVPVSVKNGASTFFLVHFVENGRMCVREDVPNALSWYYTFQQMSADYHLCYIIQIYLYIDNHLIDIFGQCITDNVTSYRYAYISATIDRDLSEYYIIQWRNYWPLSKCCIISDSLLSQLSLPGKKVTRKIDKARYPWPNLSDRR